MSPAREDEAADALRAAEAEQARLRAQLETARAGVRELEAELREQLGAFLRADAALEGGELRRELKRAQNQLQALRASPALRVGEAALEPLRRVRDVVRRARVWWRPAPLDPARVPRAFDKYRAQGAYHWDYLATRPWYVERVRAVLDQVQPGFRCLDLGCGDAAVAGRVAARCREVIGVDGDPEALRLGREKLRAAGIANVRLVLADLARGRIEALAGARFDLVYALDTIEHLPDPAPLLDLMQRHLRPDGLALVGTPLWVGEDALSPFHARELTPEQLDTLLVPRFRKVGVMRLPAPRPDRKGELSLRYALFVGRRRSWRGLWT